MCLIKYCGMRTCWEVEVAICIYTALDRMVRFTPLPFTSRERDPGTHCIGSWVSSRGCLNAVLSFLCLESIPGRSTVIDIPSIRSISQVISSVHIFQHLPIGLRIWVRFKKMADFFLSSPQELFSQFPCPECLWSNSCQVCNMLTCGGLL
jgi:hypothetical protein